MGRTKRGADQFGDHLGHGEAVVLADAVEEPEGVVLNHDAVRGEGLVCLVDPALDNLTAALPTQVLWDAQRFSVREGGSEGVGEWESEGVGVGEWGSGGICDGVEGIYV